MEWKTLKNWVRQEFNGTQKSQLVWRGYLDGLWEEQDLLREGINNEAFMKTSGETWVFEQRKDPKQKRGIDKQLWAFFKVYI